jgi:hypothetical protein
MILKEDRLFHSRKDLYKEKKKKKKYGVGKLYMNQEENLRLKTFNFRITFEKHGAHKNKVFLTVTFLFTFNKLKKLSVCF